MGMGQNIMIISLVLSLVLYVGGVQVFQNDMLHTWFNVPSSPGAGNPSLSSNVNNIPTSGQLPSQSTGVIWGLLDPLSLIFKVLATFVNVFAAELSLFTLFNGFDMSFIYLVAIPLIFIKILAVVTFIRGIMW